MDDRTGHGRPGTLEGVLGPYARPVWCGSPEPVLRGLVAEGFEEYKRETAWAKHPRAPRGGLWQGLNPQTGAVASAIWVLGLTDDDAIVFVDIDGHAVQTVTERGT